MTRSRTVRWGAGLAAALVLSAVTPTLAATAPTTTSTGASVGYVPVGSWQLLAEVNRSRRAGGRAPLKSDPRLTSVARTWAEHLSRTRKLAHNDAMFSSASKQRMSVRMLGENVGFNFSVARQHEAFMRSTGHRSNVLHTGFRTAGVAVVRDADGHLWSVQVFGTPR